MGNLVSAVSGETGFLNSTPHSLFKIFMKVEYLIGSRNVSVARSVAVKILSVCRRQVDHELLGVVGLAIFGEPSMVLQKFRHGVLTFTNISLSERSDSSQLMSRPLTLPLSYITERIHIAISRQLCFEHSASSPSFSVKGIECVGAPRRSIVVPRAKHTMTRVSDDIARVVVVGGAIGKVSLAAGRSPFRCCSVTVLSIR